MCFQSNPIFVPINGSSNSADGNVSGSESDESSVRSVRFSKLAEVREMSAHEATEALLARLSYAASIRMRRHKSNHKTAKLALLFSVVVRIQIVTWLRSRLSRLLEAWNEWNASRFQWFAANYFMQAARDMGEPTFVSLLCSSSSLFTLVLAAFFPSPVGGDKFTVTKFIAVLLNIGGVVSPGASRTPCSNGIHLYSCILHCIFLDINLRIRCAQYKDYARLFTGPVQRFLLCRLFGVREAERRHRRETRHSLVFW